MYLQYYNMEQMPFTLLPDTSFFYESASYREALNVLLVAIRSGEGFVKVTGEVGTGKTMLCRKLLNQLEDEYVTLFIPNPYLTPGQLRMALAQELGIEFNDTDTSDITSFRLMSDVTRRLVELNRAGKRVIVCLDEVQAMPVETLEALRLFSNIETEKSKLMQIVLFGQPELDERLDSKCNRQLRQRISFSYKLKTIDRQSLAGYIDHRLRVAGYHSGELFSSRAIAAIHKASNGVPRVVNNICNKALILAFGQGRSNVGYWQVRQAVADSDEDNAQRPHSLYVGIAALVVSLSAVSIWVLLP